MPSFLFKQHQRFFAAVLAVIIFIISFYYFHREDVVLKQKIKLQKSPPSYWHFEPSKCLYTNGSHVPTRFVLYWTKFFGDWSEHFAINHGAYAELDAYGDTTMRCLFTEDRTYLEKASALVFHSRDLNFADMPQTRFSWQRYVFYNHESPVYVGYSDNEWARVNNIRFNWTMTYTKKSDIYFPYGIIRRSTKKLNVKNVDEKIDNFIESFSKRPVDAVWIVSNCQSSSDRQLYASKLKALGVKIDIYGSCGLSKPDKKFKELGEQIFFSKYRFFLAFENSLCEDYITEKAFHAFYANFIAGPIPVVYGGGNYSHFFPDGSYINVRNFAKDVEGLAVLIKRLSRAAASQLRPYYDWHKTLNPAYDHDYELVGRSDLYQLYYSKRPGMRELCRRIWTDHVPSTVENVRDKMGKCTKPSIFFNK